MSRIELIVDDAPWVISRFTSTFEPEELEDYFARMSAFLDREERLVHITDLSDARVAQMSTAMTRRAAGTFIRQESARMARLTIAAAQVVESPIARGALTAIFWVAPPPHPTTTVATLAEAVAWLRPRARAAGLMIPPRYAADPT